MRMLSVRHALIASVVLVTTGCQDGGPTEGGSRDLEAFTTVESALNGNLDSTGSLTRLTFQDSSESDRENDTNQYYQRVRVGPNGTSGGTIASALPTLTSFRMNYGFPNFEVVTYYYNRGDLGIGREMHCLDAVNTPGLKQIACYVKNFAAGDDNSEFTFGLSSNVAFANLHANHEFATVAMVYRDLAPQKDKVFFAVYDSNDNLVNAAALDRPGISFAQAFKLTAPNNPDPRFGTPGVNFNNHIPSNCISCHGGQAYDKAGHSETGALFLPFDLDQFDYENISGRMRADQLNAFKLQNEMVRKVAALSGYPEPGAQSVVAELDAFYNNVSFQTDRTEVFENDFNSNALPVGWIDGAAFNGVVRGSCVTCHVTDPGVRGLTFDSQGVFNEFAATAVSDLCGLAMPHSFQALRSFWLSNRPATLESYYRGVGASAAADTLHNCALSNNGHAGVVTLDPPEIQASMATML